MHGENFNSTVGERDEFGYYYCRAGCENVFLTTTPRNRLEMYTLASLISRHPSELDSIDILKT